MAVMQSRDNRTFTAGADLSTSQFKFVKLDGADVVPGTAGDNAMGVCLNNPASGGAATVCVSGKALVECGGGVAAGAAVAVVDATGRIADAVATDIILGYALETGVTGQIVAIEVIQGGNAA